MTRASVCAALWIALAAVSVSAVNGQQKPPKNWKSVEVWTKGDREAAISGLLSLIPVQPCRVLDTRVTAAPLAGGETRNIPVSSGACGVPATAQAYSLNFTVVPSGALSFLSAWPAGQARPVVSTLNSFEGAVVANAAIVPAGVNGAVSIFATDRTDVVIDINGYFDANVSSSSLPFYSVRPCRVADTRPSEGFADAFGPPVMAGGSTRTIPVPLGRCSIPSNVRAYSLNITVVPREPLSFLTVYPTGQARPLVSTLNSFQGIIVANAAVAPAGANGSIDVFVTNTTDVIVDINGYFAQ